MTPAAPWRQCRIRIVARFPSDGSYPVRIGESMNRPLDKLREITAKNVAQGGAIYEQRSTTPEFTPPATLDVLDSHRGFTALTRSGTLWRPGAVLKRGTTGTLAPGTVNRSAN